MPVSDCGRQPSVNDFRKKNGRIRWGSYNKANTRWLKCVKTAQRQDPANVAARQETAQQLGALGIETGGNIATGILASQGFYAAGQAARPVDMSGKPPPPPPVENGLPDWLLPAAVVAGAAFLLMRE
jgi:hypothetical protein